MLTRIHICLADVRLTFASVSHMFLPMLNFRWPFESLQQAYTHTTPSSYLDGSISIFAVFGEN